MHFFLLSQFHYTSKKYKNNYNYNIYSLRIEIPRSCIKLYNYTILILFLCKFIYVIHTILFTKYYDKKFLEGKETR